MAGEAAIRAFLAIDLPEGLRDELRKIQDRLKPRVDDIRWTRPEGIHLTLKFFGNVSKDEMDTLPQAIEKTAAGAQPFSFRLGAPGAFPGTRKPRVLWIGVEGDVAKLAGLQQGLEGNLETAGFRRENRPFRPHLTLGRFRDAAKSAGLESALETVKGLYRTESFTAEGLTLFKSDLKPGGAVYTALKYFPFGKK